MKITLCQLDFTVGDIDSNCEFMAKAYKKASWTSADLLVFPEMSILGYPPEDLIYTPKLRQDAMRAVEKLAALTAGDGPAMLVGGVWEEADNLYNTAFLLDEGKVLHRQYKHHLPNYGVFDEKRVFERGPLPEVIHWRGKRIGLFICEDLWGPNVRPYFAKEKPDMLIVTNASPFEAEKYNQRELLAKDAAISCGAPILYVNQVGGQDELVFDGGSFGLSKEGDLLFRQPFFAESVETVTFGQYGSVVPLPEPLELLYLAMMAGLRDYVDKNHFKGALIGLSGGIDSALTACVAADALGPDRVHCVMLPSRYTSDISVIDATTLATSLGLSYHILTITPGMNAVDTMLVGVKDTPTPLARENIQSRLRGLVLMAISNSTDTLLITTGNKSEMATGYATLYGDMCGAYSVLKDVYKTDVFALTKWRNAHKPKGALGPQGKIIPERIITRPPSAELRENQKDEDSLPPYSVLDPILKQMVEQRKSVEEIVALGFERETVERVAKLLTTTEYKRRQAPPGVKLTSMAFGRDRRFPLTNRFKL